jgi:YbgC/YbaW family acyl-CoA thioester hydrolase
MVFDRDDVVMLHETDASGIGHFVSQLHHLERAEFFFMEALGFRYTASLFDQYLLPRVHLEVDYLSPLHFGDAIRYTVYVAKIGRTSFTLAISVTVLKTQRLAMTAELTAVTVDPATGRPVPLPEALKNALAAYLAPPSK